MSSRLSISMPFDGTSDVIRHLDGEPVSPETIITLHEWHHVAIVHEPKRKRKRGKK